MSLNANGRASAAPNISELWYTRCPVPTASSIAISQGWLDAEFASDGIAVSSLRASTFAGKFQQKRRRSQLDARRKYQRNN